MDTQGGGEQARDYRCGDREEGGGPEGILDVWTHQVWVVASHNESSVVLECISEMLHNANLQAIHM